MPVSTKFTYEDLKIMPPDRYRYEIVDGELFVTPAPRTLHQRIVGNLHGYLWQHVRQHGLGEVFVAPYDVVFSHYTVLEPDVLFVSKARLPQITEDNLAGPPDLVAEVLSETTRRIDRDIKMKQYALHGVGEYWLLDPEAKTVEIFRLERDEYKLIARLGFSETLSSPLFPGFRLPVASLWES